MSDRPSDAMQRPSKRRTEGQITKDDLDDDDDEAPSFDPGTWKAADEETLKKRKIIKVRRHVPSAMEAAATQAANPSNPFASVSLTSASNANPFATVSLLPTKPAAPTETPAAADTKTEADNASAPVTTEAPATTAETAAAKDTSEPPASVAAVAAEASEAAAAAETKVEAAGGDQAPADAPPAPSTTAATATPAPAATATLAATSPGATPATAPTPEASTAATLGSVPPATPSLAFSSFATLNSASPFGALTSSAAKPFGGFGGFGSSNGFASLGATPATAAKSGASGFSFGSPNGGLAVAAAVHATPSSVFGGKSAEGDGEGDEEGAAPGNFTPVVTLQPAEPTVTGEESETNVFSTEGSLFEFDASQTWKERGRGELRVNVHDSGQARIVMRQKGNLRLLLNANLFPQLHMASMIGGKGVTFSCVNAAAAEEKKTGEGEKQEEEAKEEKSEENEKKSEAATEENDKAEPKSGTAGASSAKLGTYAIRIKHPEKLKEFISVVEMYKVMKPSAS